MIITPYILIGVYIIIIATALIIAWGSRRVVNYEGGRLKIFLAIVGGLSTLVTFIFYYNLVMIQNQQIEKDSQATKAELNLRMSRDVVDEIRKASLVAPSFARSLTVLTRPLRDSMPPLQQGDYYAAEAAKLALSNTIFYIWNDFIGDTQAASREASSNYVYITTFLQYAFSTELEEYWNNLYVMFSPSTQKLGHLLFEKAAYLREFKEVSTHQELIQEFRKEGLEIARSKEYIDIIRPPRSWFRHDCDEGIMDYCPTAQP